MSRDLPFDRLNWPLTVHEMTVGLYEEDEITGRGESDVSDGDVPVIWHEPRGSSGTTGKSVEIGDEVSWPVSAKEFLHFLPCGFELRSDQGSHCASLVPLTSCYLLTQSAYFSF